MSTRSFLASVLCVVCALFLLTYVEAAHAQARIHLRGTAKISAHATRDQGELVLSGTLVDDAAQPLGGQSVSIVVKRQADANDAKVIAGLRAARGCDTSADRPQMAYGVHVAGPPEAPEVVVVTDESGRFCFRAALVPDRHVAHLAWRGTNLVDAADTDISFDLSRQALVLEFDPAPRVVSLDTTRATFEASALVDDNGLRHAKSGLSITLTNERADELAKVTTNASGRSLFAVPAERLGPPGRGELRLAFAGDADTAFATHVAAIERRVNVVLRVPAAERGELTAQNPEDGIALDVNVTSSAGPVAEGGVEARLADIVVGAAPVERGVAHLTALFAAEGSEAEIRLRYVPSAPWFQPLGDATVRVPIRGPGIWSKAPILIAGIAVLAFFLIGRAASKVEKPEAAPAATPASEPTFKPHLEVIRKAAEGESGWTGLVVDAHEGSVVKGARIWIERDDQGSRITLASAGVDAHGRFRLDGVDGAATDLRIVAEGSLHARFSQPLPFPGEIAIALVLRRRALLAKLVAWARKMGKPYDSNPEPTPGHVRRAAGEDFQTARWADAVERAAFGGGAIDARAEREIERMAPPEGFPTEGVLPPKPASSTRLAAAAEEEDSSSR